MSASHGSLFLEFNSNAIGGSADLSSEQYLYVIGGFIIQISNFSGSEDFSIPKQV